jgi:titin
VTVSSGSERPSPAPNNLQNFPLISSARTSRTATTIKATLNSRPGAIYTVQFFSNLPGTDEGARFIGQKSVSVDASGNASFAFKTKKVGVGQAITATATNEFTEDTSEFSAPRAVQRG